jgi:hypothetical protein
MDCRRAGGLGEGKLDIVDLTVEEGKRSRRSGAAGWRLREQRKRGLKKGREPVGSCSLFPWVYSLSSIALLLVFLIYNTVAVSVIQKKRSEPLNGNETQRTPRLIQEA